MLASTTALPTFAAEIPYTQTFTPHTLPATDWTYFSNGEGRIEIAADEAESVASEFVTTNTLNGVNRARGNVYRATSNHFITAHALYLGRTNTSTITFFVMEGTAPGSVFTNISEAAVTAFAGTGYVEKAGLSIPLYSGRYYVVAAAWSNDLSYEYASTVSTSYIHGIWEAGYSSNNANPPTTATVSTASTFLYHQRIETTDEGVLRMDDSVGGSAYSTNRATVLVDYSGYSEGKISFRHRSRGDDANDEDGLFLSTNNSAYVKILDFGTSPGWLSFTVDVAAAAASNSMTLSSSTYIRFQQMDDYDVPTDGREFDDLRLYTDADIEFTSIVMGTNLLFRGLSTNKTISISSLIYLNGGDRALTNISASRYRLLSGASVITQTNIATTNSFTPFSRIAKFLTHSLTVPAATLLTNISYTIEALADATNSLAEGSESNNQGTRVIRVNHYSGNLYFSNLLTSVTIANWGDQPGQTNSPTRHFITGTGTVAGYAFGFTNLLVQKNLTTLDYTVESTDTNTIYVAAVDPERYKEIDFVRPSGVMLTRDGGRADFKVTLPAGAGFNTNAALSRLNSSLLFASVYVNSSLRPLSAPVASSVVRYFCEETKPLLVETVANGVSWDPDLGRFLLIFNTCYYVREDELSTLEGMGLAPGLKNFRPLNEQFYRRTVTSGGTAIIRAGSGGKAELSINVNLLPHDFYGHFPYNLRVATTNQGVLDIVNDAVNASASYLAGVKPLPVAYATACGDGCLGSQVYSNIFFKPNSSELRITPDGGLHAQGTLTQAHTLAWGMRPDLKFAQRVTNWLSGNLHAPGHFLPGGVRAAAVDIDLTPGVVLLTGVDTNGLTSSERFGTAAYATGAADYAGVNFRVGTDNAKKARSTLGMADSGAYNLKGNSKYYARYSGVSGLHQAMPAAFPTNLTVYSYPFEFSSYGLNYLSNSNRDSRTDGLIELPYPSQFDQAFEELKFTCPGDLASAQIPGGSSSTNMAYWNAIIDIYAMTFERNSGCTNIGTGYLTLGLSSYAQHVEPPMHGRLGFFANGNLIPGSFGLSGVDSRLSLPAVIELDGPQDEIYRFQPVTKSYFNSYSNAGTATAPAEGFISLAGTIDVPFFQDLMAQMHLPPGTGTVGSIYLMGGWPDAGWKAGGSDFFNDTSFDGDNKGWSGSAGSIATYRAQTDTNFMVRARQSWLGLVKLSYPVKWSQSAKSFTSSEEITSSVLVLSVQHQVDYLSADNAELSFGLQYDGLPRINLANMAVNTIDEATGVGQAFIDAAGDEIVGSLDQGITRLDELIDNQANELMDSVLDTMFDPIINSLYTNLQASYVPGTDYYTAAISNYIKRTTSGSINHAVRNLASGLGYTTNVIGQVDSALADVENMLQAIIGTVTIDPITGATLLVPQPGILSTPEFPLVGNLADQLLQVLAQDIVNSIGADLAPKLEEARTAVEPSLDAIVEIATELLGRVQETRASLAGASAFANELKGAVTTVDANLLTDTVAADLELMFADLPDAHNPFSDYSPEEMKAMIRAKIEARLFGSTIMANLTRVIRAWVYDMNAQIRESIDSMFQQVNTMMKEVVSSYLSQVDDSINEMLGSVSDTMGTGQIDGYAHITGDSLKELRLDGKFQWKVPDDMEFRGYLLIQEIESGGSSGCNYGSDGVANTVEIGATDVGVNWLASDVAINVAVKFTLDDGLPAGVGGSLELASGTINFEAFAVDDFGAAVMFGADENYLAGRIRASFSAYEVAGGAFFGRTCTLTPIELVDPDVAEVLGAPPFSGIYVYGEGWMPIVDLGCIFNISAGVGAGFFYFVEGPTIGAKMLLGVSGEALCVVGVAGEVKLIGVKSGDDLTAKGTGTIKGRAGSCPFCVEFKESVSVFYKNGSWDVEY